jgi:hypothetical protein
MNVKTIRPGYMLYEMSGEAYLLPYGQNITEHKKGLQLNASGVYLWKLMQDTTDEEILLTKAAAYYQAKPDELPLLLADIRNFMDKLTCAGILLSASLPLDEKPAFLRLGSLVAAFYGDARFLTQELHQFMLPQESPSPHCVFILHEGKPPITRNGTILIRSKQLTIAESEQYYLFYYEQESHLLECHLEKAGSRADFYYLPPITPDLILIFFHALRSVVLTIAQQKGLFVLHSASLLYQDEAWLFSGKSGTGKTTHTNLWKELYHTPILNGDLNMIGFENGQPMVFGLPWCGTSGTFTAKKYPLGGVMLLKQGPANRMLPQSPGNNALLLAQRLISPDWTPLLMKQNLEFAQTLSRKVPIMRLMCTKDDEAAITSKAAIDESLQNREQPHA